MPEAPATPAPAAASTEDKVKSATVATATPQVIVATPQAATLPGDNVLAAAPLFDASPVAPARTDSPAGDGAGSTAARLGASSSDAVLATAVVVDIADFNLGDRLVQLLQGDELQRRFEEIQRRALEEVEARRDTVSTSIVATGTLSIGYVVWLVRGGVLMSSMLSALPAWQLIDPMPVLAAGGARRGPRGGGASDDSDAERLFDRSSDTRSDPARRVPAGPDLSGPQPPPRPAPMPATAASAGAEDHA